MTSVAAINKRNTQRNSTMFPLARSLSAGGHLVLMLGLTAGVEEFYEIGPGRVLAGLPRLRQRVLPLRSRSAGSPRTVMRGFAG